MDLGNNYKNKERGVKILAYYSSTKGLILNNDKQLKIINMILINKK